jgi:hypothetical protein
MLCLNSRAQYYHNFNSFFSQYHYRNNTRAVFCDTFSKKVYFLGEHTKIVHDSVNEALIEYDGDSLRPLLTLTGNYSGSNLDVITKYNGKLYIGGANDDFLHGRREVYMLVYDGNQWDTLPQSPNGYVTCLVPHDNKLYVAGYFTMVGTDTCNNVAYLDSMGWHALDQGICPPPNLILRPYSMVFYRDTLYMGGTLEDSCRPNMFQLMRYNGSYWDTVPGWKVGNNSGLSGLAVYQDRLYVGGGFQSSDGVSLGNNIVYFDGSQWYSPGSGVSGGGVGNMTVANGKLFVCGTFSYVDGVYMPTIASWDGHQWCSIDSQNVLPPSAIACTSMGDSTIFLFGQGKREIGTDTIYGVAYWTGKTYTYQCGTYYTGVNEIADYATQLSIYPSPNSGIFTLDMTGYPADERQIYIYDQLGQTVYQTTSAQDRLQVSAKLTAGIYTVSVIQGGKRSYVRLVVD